MNLKTLGRGFHFKEAYTVLLFYLNVNLGRETSILVGSVKTRRESKFRGPHMSLLVMLKLIWNILSLHNLFKAYW